MPNTFSAMAKANKGKLLGQVFSGKRIAWALYDLLGKPEGATVIDPMCGCGDLLQPFCGSCRVEGVEIDEDVCNRARAEMGGSASVVCGNAFSKASLRKMRHDGYDVVVTNPPYIRRETYKQSQALVRDFLPVEDIGKNILEAMDAMSTLASEQKNEVERTVRSMSGLSDIAAFSCLLCMLLVKRNGRLALVLPDSWLGREYFVPVVRLLKKLFAIEYIVRDVNSVWFKGRAQVRTSLVVAKRVNHVSSTHSILHADLYRDSTNDETVTAFLPQEITFRDFLVRKQSIPNVCVVSAVEQTRFLSDISSSEIASPFRSLLLANEENFVTLSDLGISCGQGFRSGANAFFIMDNCGKTCLSRIKGFRVPKDNRFIKPIIQNQKSLPSGYTVADEKHTLSLLSIGQGFVTDEDYESVCKPCRVFFSRLPQEYQEYIRLAEREDVRGKKIPSLSAVKTNVRGAGKDECFWYTLPSFTDRHTGKVFMPRVNGGKVLARYNPRGYIVDANFISFWSSEHSSLTEEGLLALLNSVWASVFCEEFGIVMGGGALKLDAVQVRKLPVPLLDDNCMASLGELGKRLAEADIPDSRIIKRIDEIIIGRMDAACGLDAMIEKLYSIESEYINRRTK